MQVVLLREWAGWPFLDESWGWVNLPPGGSWGVDVVAVVVIMPRCLGLGGKKQDASVKSVGFPAQLMAGSLSGLALSRDNVGSTKSWGPGFCVS